MKEEIKELKASIEEDGLLGTVDPVDLSFIGQASFTGYRNWLFKYKHTYVLLCDLGNGYFDFDRPANMIEVVLRKPLMILDNVSYGLHLAVKEKGAMRILRNEVSKYEN